MLPLSILAPVLLAQNVVPPPTTFTTQAARFTNSVITQSNADANALEVFTANSQGQLSLRATVLTGGQGNGINIGSQGAISYDPDTKTLAAVNSGDFTVSVFTIADNTPKLLTKFSSGGFRPISVSIRHGIIYVLNAGDVRHDGSVVGFSLTLGQAVPIAGGVSPLSSSFPNAAQVSIAPNGKSVVVTERTTNLIDVFDLDGNSAITGSHFYPSASRTPYGFDFDSSGRLYVSEENVGSSPSFLSSYAKSGTALNTLSGSVSTTNISACWVAVTPNNRFALTTNTGAQTISTFSIDPDGKLSLVGNRNSGVLVSPLDITVSRDGRQVYVLGGLSHTIGTFNIDAAGLLTYVSSATVTNPAVGLVAYPNSAFSVRQSGGLDIEP